MSAEAWGGDVVDCSRWLAARRPPPLPLPALPPPDLTPRSGGRGTGVTVALLDGQVDADHPDLRGARVRQRTTGAPALSLPDPTGHATACASLLVGQGRRQVLGLVPKATLLTAAVLGPHGRTSDEHVVRALRWVCDEGADVLVLPFGRTRPGRSVALALRSAAEAGLHLRGRGQPRPPHADVPGERERGRGGDRLRRRRRPPAVQRPRGPRRTGPGRPGRRLGAARPAQRLLTRRRPRRGCLGGRPRRRRGPSGSRVR